MFYSGPFCLHGTFLKWINCLRLVQSQAETRDLLCILMGINQQAHWFSKESDPSWRSELMLHTVLWSSVASSLPSVLTSSVCQSVIVAFEGIIKSLSGVSNLRPARMAMNAAQHKTINSLKTRFFCDHVSQYISCVTQDIRPVWRRDAKRLDTPGSSKV